MYVRTSDRFGQVPSLESLSPATSLSFNPRLLTYSTRDVVDPRISVPAQHSLVRLSKNPSTNAAAVGMLEEIKAGRLAGIYCVNWKIPAQRALKFGKTWWTVIPPKEDAVLMLDPDNPLGGRPLITFRRELDPRRKQGCGPLPNENPFPPSPKRLDASLLKAWSSYRLWQSASAVRCNPQSSLDIPIENIIPPAFCQKPAAQPPPGKNKPTMALSVTVRPVNILMKPNDSRPLGALPLWQPLGAAPVTKVGKLILKHFQPFITCTVDPKKTKAEAATLLLRPDEFASVCAGAKPRPDGNHGNKPYDWKSSDNEVIEIIRPKGVIQHPNTAFLVSGRSGNALVEVIAFYSRNTSKKHGLKNDHVIRRLIVIVTDYRIELPELERKFGITIRRGDKEWSPADLANLNQALTLLSNGERGVLRGYAFDRWRTLRTASNPFDCGTHHPTRLIEMADFCFDHPRFDGSLSVPPPKERVPLGTFKILHEIGHAMECSEFRRTGQGTCGPQPAGTNIRQYSRIVQEFANRDSKTDPKQPLTDNISQDPAERFAEAFAVFKTNRDHLKTDFSKVYDWFITGRNHFRRGPYRDR